MVIWWWSKFDLKENYQLAEERTYEFSKQTSQREEEFCIRQGERKSKTWDLRNAELNINGNNWYLGMANIYLKGIRNKFEHLAYQFNTIWIII